MMAPAQARRLPGGRLHLQHGPIDVVLRAWGPEDQLRAAGHAAAARFATILGELVEDLPELRRPVSDAVRLHGPVARRMVAACAPFAARGVFVTGMAAVAGAVADELLATMRAAAPGLVRAYVNDGGDIAVFVGPGEALAVGMVADPANATPAARSAAGPAGQGAAPHASPPSPIAEAGLGAGRRILPFDASLTLTHGLGIGGVATSGRHGRSFSLGIADAVTVLARDAATADAAATLIANAVDLDSPAITRRPARDLDPDSDLGALPVTVAVGPLSAGETARALDAGAARARAWCEAGLIRGAALRLAGQARLVGHPFPALTETAA